MGADLGDEVGVSRQVALDAREVRLHQAQTLLVPNYTLANTSESTQRPPN